MTQNKTLIAIFASIINRFPDNKAVMCNKESITYKELDYASDNLARRLMTDQTNPGMIIALYLPSSIEAIVSMLGILKAGHAYLSLDINDPPSRTGDILDNAQPDIIITSNSYQSEFKKRDIKILIHGNLPDPFNDAGSIDKNRSEESFRNLLFECSDKITPDFLAYIIYTSGSTGKPKGIPIKHQAVINLLDDFQQRCPLDSNDKCSLWTNLNFDVSIYEIWSALLSGAALLIPDQQERSDPEKFIQWLGNSNITSAYIPPFMIADLADNQLKNTIELKRILTGVEPIPEKLLCEIKRNTPGLCLINGYGPAEATVCATLYEVPDHPANPGNAPIGKPVDNLKVYLLDESGKPVKDGENGEIYIAGIQVADGYLNAKKLSEKSFLKNPFSDGLSGLMYKTGDRGIRLKTGDIMFSGRKDFQIKIRGFRIEPGEIENVINEFKGISQAAVVLKENKTKRKILTAYIDSDPDKKLLFEFLSARLPKYMLPAVVISLDKMPLTSQDKIDKRNLIKRDDMEILNKELPCTDEEKKTAQIWEDVLNTSPIYRDDDFFSLGGDSISGVKILSRLNSIFAKNIDVNSLFEHSQLKDFSLFFSEHRDKQIKNKSLTKDRGRLKGYIPLLDDQNLIWIFEQINPGTSLYHIPLVYKIKDLIVDCDLFKQAIEIVKKQHIALQSVFEIDNDITIQKPAKTSSHFQIDKIEDIPAEDNNDIEHKWILDKTKEQFNLKKGPLFRTDLLVTGKSSCVICFTFHHIIFDGWSVGLFIEELGNIYNTLVNGQTPKLLDAGLSYHDYISDKIQEVEYDWETARTFFTSYLKDLPANQNQSSSNLAGASSPVEIDADTYNKIKNLALENQTTPFTVLLSLFQIMLLAETGQNDQITGIAYAGRDRVETESIIGFLMNTLVVRNNIKINKSFNIFLSKMKKNLGEIFKYKHIPFQRINHLCQETSRRKKVFESMFLMQTMDIPPLNLQGNKTEDIHVDMGKANCDITLELYEKESGLKGWFEYRTDVFSDNKIRQITKRFNQIIKTTVDKPEAAIGSLLYQDNFSLSPMQHGMLMETLKSPQGAGSYIEQVVFKINQEIDIKRFTDVWQTIIEHHEIMRLGFAWKNLDQPLQHIAPVDKINIEVNDWSKISKPETSEFLEMFLQADRRLGFSLTKPPLFRIVLIKTDENRYTCIWSLHHIIADGRSMVAILRDMFLLYHNPNREITSPGSFKNYIGWLNQQQTCFDAKEFWEKQLKGFTEPIELPFTLQTRSAVESRRQEHSISITTGNKKVQISSETTSMLKKICQKNSITMNSLLMGVWAVLLSHYTGKSDIVFGATRSVRRWRENGADDTGLYINTLPVRVKVNPEEDFLEFLKNVREEWVKLKNFENSSLGEIHAWSDVKWGNPLFNIFFSYDYHSIDSALEEYKEKILCSEVSLLERTPASLFLAITGIEELSVVIEYDRRLFDAGIIEKILGHFIKFIEVIGENEDPKLMDMPILTDSEREDIDQRLNSSKVHTEFDSCVHHLIGIQASLNRATTAVTDDKKSLSYGELDIFANQIAHYLIKFGAMPEKKVVLMVEQNADLIAIILGVLKSGSAYVPLDPAYPDERINYIIEDSDPEIIITSKIHEHRLNTNGARIVLFDQEMAQIKNMDKANPITDITPENMAYIIYTSGSTGKPKGVMVEHGSLISFTRSANEIYDMRADDRVLQFASISFDASAEEIFPTLFAGATLVMKPRDVVHTPSQFIDFCSENSLTVIDLPTSYWHMLADEIDSLSLPEHIRLIIIGGDEANSDKVEKWNSYTSTDLKLLNTYGPTETTVAVTWADLSSGSVKGKVSIGAPFPNVSLCILNQFQQPALPGTMGELYIGGTQTARGYLNRNDLTDKSFVQLENINRETTFFKTGDQVEMLEKEGILFYGRLDRQIKIRGFRVEPGEIEKTALLHNSVSECAVAVSEDSDNNVIIAAFLVLNKEDKSDFSTKEFRTWLLSQLPGYMVPSLLIVKDSFPYTPSGKIDYQSLKIPESSKKIVESSGSDLFNNPHENDLKIIWETILNFEVASPHDSFFDIGGSSLYAIKLVSAIEKKFNVSIPVIAVFKNSTISRLAKTIEKELQLAKFDAARLISEKGSQTPIILIGNSVNSARAYKKADLTGHPFYHAPIFIHFYDIENNKTNLLDIWQIAQKCIKDFTHFFPSGPYIIMGECMNATVAHEVACQLTNMNKEVELLVIIDENWGRDETGSSSKRQAQEEASFISRQMDEISEFGIAHIFKKFIPGIKKRIRSYFISLDSIRERLYSTFGRSIPEAMQFRAMEEIFYEACDANPYMPIPYHGNVLLFYSNNWMETYSPKLATYYKGNTKKIDLEIAHSEWFEPYSIKTIIDEIENF